MYTMSKNGRIMLDGKSVKEEDLPTSKRFNTPTGPCVVVAKTKAEKIALANAEKPEEVEGYLEALKLATG